MTQAGSVGMAVERDQLYRFEQVREILACSKATLLKFLNSGELPAAKSGRRWLVRGEDLLNFYERRKRLRAADRTGGEGGEDSD